MVITTAGKRSEEHTSELQSRENLVCRLRLAKTEGRPLSSALTIPSRTVIIVASSYFTPPHVLHSFPTRRSSDLSFFSKSVNCPKNNGNYGWFYAVNERLHFWKLSVLLIQPCKHHGNNNSRK